MKLKSLSLILGLTLTAGCASTPKSFPEDSAAFKKAFPSAYSQGKKSLSCDVVVATFQEKNDSPHLKRLGSAEKKYLDALNFKIKIDFEDDEVSPASIEKKEGLPLPFDPIASWSSGTSEKSITLNAIKAAEYDLNSLGAVLSRTYLKNFSDWKSETEKKLAPGGYELISDSNAEKVLVKENLKSFTVSYRGRYFSGKNSELTATFDGAPSPVPHDVSDEVAQGNTIYMRYFLGFDKSTKPPTLKTAEVREGNYAGYQYEFKNCLFK